EIIPERQKPLDEVTDEAEAAWIAAETSSQVEAVAEGIRKRVSEGADFNTVIGEVLPADSFGQAVKTTTSQPLSRGDENPDLGPEVIQNGFDIAKEKLAVSPSGDSSFTVLKVTDATMNSDANLEDNEIENINLTASADILAQLVQDLQSRETVSINQNAVDAAFNPHGGY
ncbi:MAG: hypothetical protein AAF412_15180, partial [Pseudomonadota bacterium]